VSIGRLIENVPPVLVLGISLLFGVALVLASTACGTSVAIFSEPPKQLGYFYEINWSLNYVLFVPMALYFFTSAFNRIREVIRGLADARMIVDGHGEILTEVALQGDWRKTSDRSVRLGVVLGLTALCASWVEWWLDFRYPDVPIAEALLRSKLGRGWNLAPLLQPPPHHIVVAKIFGFAAFTAQGIFAAMYLLFLCIIFGFAAWLYRFTTDMTDWELVPDTLSDDRRCGFENFEPLVETLLLAALCCFGVFFLIRLDHAFLDSAAFDLGGFVQNDIWAGFINGIKDLSKGSATLFQIGDIRYSVEMAGTGLVLSLVTAFFIPTILLRQAAEGSKRRAIHHNQDNPKVLEKIDKMVLWPMLYPQPVELLGFLFLAAMCFIYYKLTLVLVGVALAAVLTKFVKVLQSSR
jgi:hypothetical protein